MREPKVSVVVTIRLPMGLMEAINDDIESTGDYNSRSQWIASACRAYLTQRSNGTKKL